MLNFLARLMGLVVVGIFFLALGFFVLSSYLGFDFSEKFDLSNASQTAMADSRLLKAEKLTPQQMQEFTDLNREDEIATINEASDFMLSGSVADTLSVPSSKSNYEVLNKL